MNDEDEDLAQEEAILSEIAQLDDENVRKVMQSLASETQRSFAAPPPLPPQLPPAATAGDAAAAAGDTAAAASSSSSVAAASPLVNQTQSFVRLQDFDISQQVNAANHVLQQRAGCDSTDAGTEHPVLGEDDCDDYEDRTTTANGDVSMEALGLFKTGDDDTRGTVLHPIPYDDMSAPISSVFAAWTPDQNHRLRGVRHMAFNIPLCLFRDNPEFLSSFRHEVKHERNQRIQSTAAIFGMFGINSKGFFPFNADCVEEDLWRDLDEEAKAKKMAAAVPMKAYLFTHRYVTRQGEDDHSKQWPPVVQADSVPGNKDRPPEDRCHFAKQVSPMFSFCLETLYSRRKDFDPRIHEHDVGHEVGLRIHMIVWNPKFSTVTLVNQAMDENAVLHRAARVSRMPEAKRKQGTERSSKQQRHMVADQSAEFVHAKYVSISDNSAMVHHLAAISGADLASSRSTPRGFYRDLRKAFGRSGLNVKMDAKPETGSSHALSFEHVFNIRREDGLPMVAGMLDEDGIEIDIHPAQMNPKSYYDDEYRLCFPLGEQADVFMLCNNTISLLDCALPNTLRGDSAAGQGVLEAYWCVKERDLAVKAAEDAVINEWLESHSFRQSDAQRTWAREVRGLPSFTMMSKRLQQLFQLDIERMSSGQKSTNIQKKLNYTRMLHPDSLDITPQERSGAGGAAAGSASVDGSQLIRRVKLANIETGTVISEVVKIVRRARDIKQLQMEQEFSRRRAEGPQGSDAEEVSAQWLKKESNIIAAWFADATSEALKWGLKRMNRTMTDVDNESTIEPVARSIWNSSLRLFEMLPDAEGARAKIDLHNPRRRNGSANVAFLFDKRMDSSNLSPHGNYHKLLVKLYGQVIGYNGRVLGPRLALHFASFTPMTTGTLRGILSILGPKGVAKSMTAGRFRAIFNREVRLAMCTPYPSTLLALPFPLIPSHSPFSFPPAPPLLQPPPFFVSTGRSQKTAALVDRQRSRLGNQSHERRHGSDLGRRRAHRRGAAFGDDGCGAGRPAVA